MNGKNDSACVKAVIRLAKNLLNNDPQLWNYPTSDFVEVVHQQCGIHHIVTRDGVTPVRAYVGYITQYLREALIN